MPSPAETKIDPLQPAGLRSDREPDRLSGRERDDNRDALRDRRDVIVELLGVGVAAEVHIMLLLLYALLSYPLALGLSLLWRYGSCGCARLGSNP